MFLSNMILSLKLSVVLQTELVAVKQVAAMLALTQEY
jgi:hypothetical protein